MNWIRRTLGKVFIRFEIYANSVREQERRIATEQSAVLAATTRIGPSTRFNNNRRDRRFITVGPHTVVWGELMTHRSSGRIDIGAWCFVGEHSKIWSADHVLIGDHVLISHNVNIHDHNSHPSAPLERREDAAHVLRYMELSPIEYNIGARAIVIESDVWVGFNAIVLPGVRIGKGAIVGAGTVVTRDVPAHTVVVGNPMRFVRTLSPAEQHGVEQ